jgi:hypothetical protein
MVTTSQRRRLILKNAEPFLIPYQKKAMAKWLLLIAIFRIKAKRIDFERIAT